MADIIMNLVDLKKVLPNGKELLSGIYLSFFRGAKIGVIGINGAGKSTLMRIISGQDTDYLGEVILSDGITVGYLAQEPTLEEDLTVRENVELGMKATKDLLERFEAINMRFAEPMDDEAILASVRKTRKAVIVDEDYPRCSMAGDISALIAEEAFDYLDAPPRRVTPPHTSVPYSSPLEALFVPTVERVVEAAISTLE